MQPGLLGGQPDGAEPDALGAQGEPGGDLFTRTDAAGREHGQRVDGADDFGGEHHGGDLAGVTAGLVALGDDDVDTGVPVVPRVPGAAREGGDEDAVRVGAFDDVGGW